MNAIPLSFTTSLSKWDCARYVWESDDPMTDGLLGRLISYLEEKGLVNIKPEIDAADAAALHKDTEYRKSEYLEVIAKVQKYIPMISVTPIQVSLNWCIDERMAERLYCWVIESRLYRNQSIHLGKASFLAEILEALSHSGTYYYEQIYDPGEKINLYSLQESWKDFRKNELIGIFSPNNRESGPRN